MGLAYAYSLVPDETVRKPIRDTVNTAMRVLVLEDQWAPKLPPDGEIAIPWLGEFDMQLSFLRTAATVDPAQWLSVYQHFAPAAALAWLPGWFSTFDTLSRYYGFNLNNGTFGPALFLEDNPQIRKNYMNAYMITRSATERHRNAYFDLVRVLVELPKDRPAAAAGVKNEVSAVLGEYLARLALVAASSGFPTNKIPNAQAIIGAWRNSVQPYQTLNGGTPYVTKFVFPLQQQIGDSDFLWEDSPLRTGFHLGSGTCGLPAGAVPTTMQLEQCSSAAYREGSGVDFLLPYWMANYLGILAK